MTNKNRSVTRILLAYFTVGLSSVGVAHALYPEYGILYGAPPLLSSPFIAVWMLKNIEGRCSLLEVFVASVYFVGGHYFMVTFGTVVHSAFTSYPTNYEAVGILGLAFVCTAITFVIQTLLTLDS